MEELFEKKEEKELFDIRPLAYRMRPCALDSFVGQGHLLDSGKKLRRMIDSGMLFSVIFYGPPGCGKSALANVIACSLEAKIEKINAVNSNVKEIRLIIEKAKYNLTQSQKTILIVDEIHRFNRSQQDSLLPDVEEGNIILVGITTENPFYFISGPLLSRASIFKFEPLSKDDIRQIIINAAGDKVKGLGRTKISIPDGTLDIIIGTAEGDARYALNLLELAVSTTKPDNGTIDINEDVIRQCMGEKKYVYDRTGDQHYDTISAFIKSMRGSDPDAAVFYMAKMISSGEDPRFIARRIAICASEDVGNADPQALILANSALNAVEYVGMPEAQIILAQAAVYMACAPKSNASCTAINRAMEHVKSNEVHEVPHHLTKSGSSEYKYPHNYKYGYIRQKYMIPTDTFYEPVARGHEKYIRKYLKFIREQEDEG
ncbi:replication-associated recombination protein A [Elusimicrobiota bacterium]